MATATVTIDPQHSEGWPNDLLQVFNGHHTILRDWEGNRVGVAGQAYDAAIREIGNALQAYSMTGWHCSRLTDDETESILASGMRLPDLAMLHGRIDALVASGKMYGNVAAMLKARNQAHCNDRAGMVWFCFFPPRDAGEHGIGRFFRHWGGEALYNSHESDAITSACLRSIGTPCIVEAEVPISFMAGSFLEVKLMRRFLVDRGFHTDEPIAHEGRIRGRLPADLVRRVIRFPENDFIALTGCSNWTHSL